MHGWKSLAASPLLSVPVVSSSGASPHAARVAAASSATRPLETTFLVFNTNASKFVTPDWGQLSGSMMPPVAHPVTRFGTSEMRLRHKSPRTTFGGTCQRPLAPGMRHSGRLQGDGGGQSRRRSRTRRWRRGGGRRAGDDGPTGLGRAEGGG